MPDKERTLQILALFMDGMTTDLIAARTGIPQGTARRYVWFFGLLKQGVFETEISRMTKWSEETVSEMRRWVAAVAPHLSRVHVEMDDECEAQQNSIVPTPAAENAVVGGTVREHVDELVAFAFGLTGSLAIPRETLVSGVEQDYWDLPYGGPLGGLPSIRSIDSEDGQKLYRALLTHLPTVELDPAVERVCSLLQSYARSIHILVALISGMYTDRGAGGPGTSVPPGVILSTLRFGIDASGSMKPPGVNPVVEKNPDGSAVLRIGGWSSTFTEPEIATKTSEVFADVVREIGGSSEVQVVSAARSEVDISIKGIKKILPSKAGLGIAIARTSCHECKPGDESDQRR